MTTPNRSSAVTIAAPDPGRLAMFYAETTDGEVITVLADPVGHPFCLTLVDIPG